MPVGTVSEEALAALLATKGKWTKGVPWWNEISLDAIKHFSWALGETNPLYLDQEHGKKSRWGAVQAFPCIVFSTVRARPWSWGLPGVQALQAGERLEWSQPVLLGMKVRAWSRLSELIEKPSRHAGRAWDQINEIAYVNINDGTVVGHVFSMNKRFEGGRTQEAPKRKTYEGFSRHIYTDKELAQIERDALSEQVRGANQRYWEDVVEGEEIPPVVYGPLTVSDEVIWIAGDGGPFRFTGKEKWEYWRRHPGAKIMMKEWNTPEFPEAIHWEPAMARVFGAPDAFDVGVQRTTWLARAATNWQGDDGFLRRLDAQTRGFNFIGDTTWCRGRVTRKFTEGPENLAELDLWGVNQRGETTAKATAVVSLPSRKRGPITLPRPPRAEDWGIDYRS